MNTSTFPLSWETIEKLMRASRVVYLWGPPGIGKTYTAKSILGGYVITMSEDMVLQELLGTWIPGDRWTFVKGAFVLALEQSSLIINEIDKASFSVKDALLAILDSSESCEIVLPNSEVVRPHPEFKTVITSNQPPDSLDIALQDRFDVVLYVNVPHPNAIERIREACKSVEQKVEGCNIRKFADVVNKSWKDPERGISIRKAFSFINLIQKGIDIDAAGMAVFQGEFEEIKTLLQIDSTYSSSKK